ncbi:MAG: IclR family transcriptional regulator [Betaproteobacteria bacterium]|nr:IclR family transcriptional regulator [Betaproteobacteria bacterium]
MEKTQRGIQSIEVGGRLLTTLSEVGEPMTLKDLAQQSDMPAAKAHPYLVSFGKLGLVEQNAATSRYELGPLALQLGLTCLRRLNPVRLGSAAATALAGTLHQTVALAVWGNAGPTIVHIEESSHPIHINMRTGTVMSLFKTATGRVFAACLPEKAIEHYIDTASHHAYAYPRSDLRPSWNAMQKTLKEIRKTGMAQVVSEPLPGINALSAPVFDHEGRLALVITVFGPTALFDPALDGDNASALRQCCSELSHRLGHVPG